MRWRSGAPDVTGRAVYRQADTGHRVVRISHGGRDLYVAWAPEPESVIGCGETAKEAQAMCLAHWRRHA